MKELADVWNSVLGGLSFYSEQWVFVSAVLECRFCCVFTVWLLFDCYPAVSWSAALGQVTGLLRWKSNQANPLRSLTILSAGALHRRPSATHTAHATHTYNELFERYGDGHMHINQLTSCELGADCRGPSAPQKTLDRFQDCKMLLTLHSGFSAEVTEMNFPLGGQ